MLNLPNSLSRRRAIVALTAATLLTTPASLWAQDAAQKGLEIAARSDASDRGFRDSQASLKMVLRNASGQRSSREMRLLTMERPGQNQGDMSASVFLTPADIKGTVLLSHANIRANDDQWLFLPATKRTKRISSANKTGPFMGSEFSYEDITAQEVGKFRYLWLRQEKCGGATCDVIERIPTYKNSGYSRQVVWIDQKTNQFQQVDFFDRAGNHVKRMIYSKYKRISGIWRPHQISMTNLRNGKSTDLVFSNYKFKTGLGAADFQPAAIARFR